MEIKNIHIGKIVENVFNQSQKNKAEFAKDIGIASQNVNRYFNSEDWSVIKLIMAGKSLNHDFGYLFSSEEGKAIRPKMLVQIEIDESKIEYMLKLLGSEDLISVVK